MQTIMTGVPVALILMAGAMLAGDAVVPSEIVLTQSELEWGEPPAVFERGASFTVVSGDPSKPGIFVVRLKMPAGYAVAPHWHPTDEHVTVLSGTLAIGIGKTFDEGEMKMLPAGGYAYLPAETPHYVMAATETTIQVEGPGPFALTYFNPADDPSQRSSDS